ncbi:exonuclease [Mycobacterium phage Frankie]|nr:exonuclease [Mycobacterium phage Frankie]
MTLTVFDDVIQGTDEWFDQRRGMITASTVGQLITVRKLGAIEFDCPACDAPANDPCRSKAKAGAVIKTLHPERAEVARLSGETVIEPSDGSDYSRSLSLLLVAERITGWTDPTFVSDDMMRGIEEEPFARAKYAEHYAPVTETGFMVEDRWGFKIGYSPDGLVGDDGLIEIKSRRSKTQLATILSGAVPTENMAQLQCGLLVSGRKWIDYVSWCGGMPMYIQRVYPDPQWQNAIIAAVAQFEENAEQMIRNYREAIVGLHATEKTPREIFI